MKIVIMPEEWYPVLEIELNTEEPLYNVVDVDPEFVEQYCSVYEQFMEMQTKLRQLFTPNVEDAEPVFYNPSYRAYLDG